MEQKRTRSSVASINGHNATFRSGKRADRRIEKTEKTLREALASLIAEKPYDSISVKEILERANVGRSTFYTHFRDKDDLLVSSIHGIVESLQTAKLRRSPIWYERILWFSLPILDYHYGHRRNHRRSGPQTLGVRARSIQHDRLKQVLAEMIADPVRAECSAPRKTSDRTPLDLIARYVASTFVLVLDWWNDSRNPVDPSEADDLFRALVLPTLSALRA